MADNMSNRYRGDNYDTHSSSNMSDISKYSNKKQERGQEFEDDILGNEGQKPAGTVAGTQLTKEEMKLLTECNSESFYKRCMPFMFAANAAAFLYLQRLSPVPSRQKIMWTHSGATLIGWFSGKLSYQKQCEDKFLNSNLDTPMIRMLRKNRGMTIEYSDNYIPPSDDSSYLNLPVYEDDNYNQDSRDDNQSGFLDPKKLESDITYDKLREANRKAFQEPIRRQF